VVNTTYAANSVDVEDLAQRGAVIIEKIEKLESKENLDTSQNATIAALHDELEEITIILNEYGLYTEEQFKKMKENRQQINEEQLPLESCSGTCDPVLFMKAGFDWRMYGYWYGTTPASNWKIYDEGTETSIAYQTPNWGVEYFEPYTLAFVDEGYGSVNVEVKIKNSSGVTQITYDDHDEFIPSAADLAEPERWDELAYSPAPAGSTIESTVSIFYLIGA
jgi:hypothetical protein